MYQVKRQIKNIVNIDHEQIEGFIPEQIEVITIKYIDLRKGDTIQKKKL